MNEDKMQTDNRLMISFFIEVPTRSYESDFNSLILKVNELKQMVFNSHYCSEFIEIENKERNILIGQIQDLLNNFIVRDYYKEGDK